MLWPRGVSIQVASYHSRQFGVHPAYPGVDADRKAQKRKAITSKGIWGYKEVIMSVLFRFNGQAAYEVDTGRRKKIRVVFGVIDETRTSMAWYWFSSDGVAKSKLELANPDPMPPEEFGHRAVGGRDIPHTFKKNIGLDELAIHPKGTPATLTLVIENTKRFIECRIDQLTTKAKEVVTFTFGLQYDLILQRRVKSMERYCFWKLRLLIETSSY